MNKRHAGVRIAALACASLGWAPLPAAAIDYQIHGFGSETLVYSTGNNIFGDSTHVSPKAYDLGVNGTVDLGHGLLIAAQGLLRGVNQTGGGQAARLDYALVDYQFLANGRYGMGLRAGRVKVPLGFYNQTRDMLFTRPGVLMPQSVYFEPDLRNLLFSSDGAQLYGWLDWAGNSLDFVGGYNLPFTVSSPVQQVLAGGRPLPGRIRVTESHVAQVQDKIDGGRWRFALNYLHGQWRLDMPMPTAAVPHGHTDLYVLSAQYNARRFSLTAEYRNEHNVLIAAPGAFNTNTGAGYYLQLDYRPYHSWKLMTRYGISAADVGDPGGRRYAMTTGGSRYSRYAHDWTLGANWAFAPHWGAWAEYHNIAGNQTAPALDNQGSPPASHWSIYMLALAFRF